MTQTLVSTATMERLTKLAEQYRKINPGLFSDLSEKEVLLGFLAAGESRIVERLENES